MKTDARVRYTRMRIQQAFFECLAQKPIARITVKQLCEIAEINRATFYKHYADPFDLLEQQKAQALCELEQMLNQPGEWDLGQMLTVMGIVHPGKEPSKYALLASRNGDPGFFAQISEVFYRRFHPGICQLLACRTPAEQTAAYLFLSGGCGYLLTRWKEHGTETSLDAVVAAIEEMCTVFIHAYGKGSGG